MSKGVTNEDLEKEVEYTRRQIWLSLFLLGLVLGWALDKKVITNQETIIHNQTLIMEHFKIESKESK